MLLLLFHCIGIAQIWNSDFNSGLEQARLENRNLLVYFAMPGCEACLKLETEVFAQEIFIKYAAEQLILIKPDFELNPSDKAKRLLIVEKYNKDGFFPWIVVLDSNGKKLAHLSYDESKTAADYLKSIVAIATK